MNNRQHPIKSVESEEAKYPFMERKNNSESLHQIFEIFLKQNGIWRKYQEQKTINNWNKLVGINIANATTDLHFVKQTLHISVRSSIIRHELLMHKTELIKIINSNSEEPLINDVIIH